jgi:hypothetical protein
MVNFYILLTARFLYSLIHLFTHSLIHSLSYVDFREIATMKEATVRIRPIMKMV